MESVIRWRDTAPRKRLRIDPGAPCGVPARCAARWVAALRGTTVVAMLRISAAEDIPNVVRDPALARAVLSLDPGKSLQHGVVCSDPVVVKVDEHRVFDTGVQVAERRSHGDVVCLDERKLLESALVQGVPLVRLLPHAVNQCKFFRVDVPLRVLTDLVGSQKENAFLLPCHKVRLHHFGLKDPERELAASTVAWEDPVLDADSDGDPDADEDPDSSGRRYAGDDIKHRGFYKPSDLVDWLKAYQFFKHRVDLKAAIIALLQALLSDADMLSMQEELIGLIESGRLRIPHSKTIERFTCRLDAASFWKERREWFADVKKVTSLSFDASDQCSHSVLACMENSFIWPEGATTKDLAEGKVDFQKCTRDCPRPLMCVGFGASALSHKLLCAYHIGTSSTSDDTSFSRWRWSVIGGVSDQGTERLMLDCPNVKDPAEIEAAAEQLAAGTLPDVPRPPEHFLFPRAMSVRGPFHITYNAFERAVKGAEDWPWLKERISACLCFLGWKGSRRRFLSTCVPDAEEKKMFANFPHHLIDFKWQYLESMLVDLDRIVLLFLERFDGAMFRAGDVSGEEEEAAAGGEQAREAMADAKKSIAAIESMQAEKHDVALMVRAQRTFSRAVGKEVRWYTGCDCHDHIWRDTSLSDAEKERRVRAETGIQGCCWRRRRASSLARGHTKTMVQNVRHALEQARDFSAMCGACSPQTRARALHFYQSMSDTFCEELERKNEYWIKLPHILCGIWPADRRSQGICAEALRQWDDMLAKQKRHFAHRVTLRNLDTQGFGHGLLPVFLRQCVETGELHPDLVRESLEMNCVVTCEQPLEGIHAKLSAMSQQARHIVLPPDASARLRCRYNMNSFDSVKGKAFLNAMMPHRYKLIRGLLDRRELGDEFCNKSSLAEARQALYRCHPKQLYKSVPNTQYLVSSWSAILRQPLPAFIPVARSMVLYFKGRLPAATVFSLPQNLLNPTAEEYMEVGLGMFPEALLACVAPAAGLGVELSAAHRSECFYKARFFLNLQLLLLLL